MRNSEIKLNVTLDTQNVPQTITWEATDGPAAGPQQTKAFSLSIWGKSEGISAINLWDQEMTVPEMKAFVIQAIASLGQTLADATNDTVMAEEIDGLCSSLASKLRLELEQSGQSI